MAQKGEIIAAVDFGSRAVRVVITRHTPTGQTRVIGYGVEPSRGCVRFGAVQDLNAAMQTFRAALNAARSMAGVRIYALYCGIHGAVIKSGVFKGKTQVENHIIKPEHLEAARENASHTSMEVDCVPISSVMAEEWTVDDVRVTAPIGMRGSMLEGKVHFAQLPKFIENNLNACIESQGVHIEEFVFMPLAAAAGCLACEDIQLGAAVVDLGAASTGVAVYYNGGIAAATALNLGCGFIINDIAAGLRVSFDEATELLLEYGISSRRLQTLARGEGRNNGNDGAVPPAQGVPIKLQRTGIGAPTTVSRDELDTIVFARSVEIANRICDFLKKNKYMDRLSRGIVLTGGGAAINNQSALMETKSDQTVRIGVPEGIEELPEFLDLPEWTPVMGIIKYAVAHRQAIHSGQVLARYGNGNSLWARVNRFRSKYFI